MRDVTKLKGERVSLVRMEGRYDSPDQAKRSFAEVDETEGLRRQAEV